MYAYHHSVGLGHVPLFERHHLEGVRGVKHHRLRGREGKGREAVHGDKSATSRVMLPNMYRVFWERGLIVRHYSRVRTASRRSRPILDSSGAEQQKRTSNLRSFWKRERELTQVCSGNR